MSDAGLQSRHTEQVETYVRTWTAMTDRRADLRIVVGGKS
jgi:hypothetical protein